MALACRLVAWRDAPCGLPTLIVPAHDRPLAAATARLVTPIAASSSTAATAMTLGNDGRARRMDGSLRATCPDRSVACVRSRLPCRAMAPSSPHRVRGAESRLVLVVSAVVFVDTMFYAVI